MSLELYELIIYVLYNSIILPNIREGDVEYINTQLDFNIIDV